MIAKRWWTILPLTGLTAAASTAPVAATPGARWIWSLDSGELRSVSIDFVRGTAAIVRRAGPVRVEVQKRSVLGHQDRVSIDVEDHLGHIRITDRYPAPLGRQWAECRPATPRGNFWDSDVRLHVVVHAPEGVDIAVRFLDGAVRR